MNKKAILGVFLILLSIFSSINTNIKAVDSFDHTHTDDAYYDTWYKYNGISKNSYVQLTNGKMVIAYGDEGGTSYIFIKVFTALGVEESSVRFQIEASYNVYTTSLYRVSDTVVYVFVQTIYLTNPSYMRHRVIKFNPSTLVYSTVSTATTDLSSDCDQMYANSITEVWSYNSKYYALSSICTKEAGTGMKNRGQMWLMEYTPDTTLSVTSLVSTGSGSAYFLNEPYAFQEGVGSATVYALVCYTGASLKLVAISLSGKTMTDVVSYPISTDAWDVLNGDEFTSRFYGGFITQSGSDIAVQFTFVNSIQSSGSVVYRFCNWISYYTTSVSTANFVKGERDSFTWTCGFSGRSYGSWNVGTMPNKQQLVLYYLDYLVSLGGGYLAKATIDLEGTYMTDDLTLAYEFEQPSVSQIPTNDLSTIETMCYAYDFSSAFAVVYTPTDTLIYYGLSSVITSYDITLSYTPADSPLKTQKTYTFTVTTYANGIVSSQYVKVFINDVFYNYYHTSATTGAKAISITFNSANSYDITIGIYNPNLNTTDTLYDETFTYSVIADDTLDDTETGNILFSGSINMLLTYLPLLVVVFLPAVEGGQLFGGIGFFMGAVIGTVFGTLAGIVPSYILYMLILLLAVAGVIILRRGSGGGEQ